MYLVISFNDASFGPKVLKWFCEIFLRFVAQKSLCPEAWRLQYAFNLRTLDKPESGEMVLLPLLPFFPISFCVSLSLSLPHALSLFKRFIDKYHNKLLWRNFCFHNISNILLNYLYCIPFIYLYIYARYLLGIILRIILQHFCTYQNISIQYSMH